MTTKLSTELIPQLAIIAIPARLVPAPMHAGSVTINSPAEEKTRRAIKKRRQVMTKRAGLWRLLTPDCSKMSASASASRSSEDNSGSVSQDGCKGSSDTLAHTLP